MALEKSIENDEGLVASYWRVSRLYVDRKEKIARVKLSGYKNRSVRLRNLDGVMMKRLYQVSNDPSRVVPRREDVPENLFNQYLPAIEEVVPNQILTGLITEKDDDFSGVTPEKNLRINHEVDLENGYSVQVWSIRSFDLNWKDRSALVSYEGYPSVHELVNDFDPAETRSVESFGLEFDALFSATTEQDDLEENTGFDRSLAYTVVKSLDPEMSDPKNV